MVGAESAPGHEHEPVVVGILEAEPRISETELADPGHAAPGPGRRPQEGEETAELVLAQGVQEGVLVLEVVVDGGGGVLDGKGDAPHGDTACALGHEELAGRVQDLVADLLALPAPPLRHAHGRLPRVA